MKLQIRWNVPSISPYSFRSRRVITSTTRIRSSSYCDKPFILPPTARDINSEIKYFLWVLEACCRSLMPAIGLTGSFRFVTSMSITPRTTSMPRWTSRSYAFPSLLCLYMFLCLCFAMLSFSKCSYMFRLTVSLFCSYLDLNRWKTQNGKILCSCQRFPQNTSTRTLFIFCPCDGWQVFISIFSSLSKNHKLKNHFPIQNERFYWLAKMR